MFDPIKFLHLAKDLYEKDPDNTCNSRTCINRAYYAAYLIVRNFSSLSDKDKRVHKHVIDELKSKNFVLGNSLSKLFEVRKHSDYELDKEITKDMSKNAIDRSEFIIQNILKV